MAMEEESGPIPASFFLEHFDQRYSDGVAVLGFCTRKAPWACMICTEEIGNAKWHHDARCFLHRYR